ncbi:hypothetical protein AI3059V2_5400 (plasmid) [Citrobacter freundii]|uniref:Uncharacterized protein n=1 Tax=Citrobacter freundii TaxID=546 RepID=A0AAD1U0Y3_CITFR|nr:hypothetical protein AI2935V1_5266 [Citrobacter freundii]CAF9738660.1 hypothetical protein AI3059V2_5400 [Citrobacter freundii]CAH6288916.1 hypothetical protein AI3059V2_5400 [Citrobacter freundii]CAH6622540.1 hypothetical protein AI2935V1_5266 [Citrobacter freundii]
MLKRAFDRASMSVSFGKEAANHYCEPYPRSQALKDWFQGFCEVLFRCC